MTTRIGKLYNHKDPRVDQEIRRLYEFVNQLSTGNPPEAIDGRAVKRNSLLADRVAEGSVTGVNLSSIAEVILGSAVWSTSVEDVDIRRISMQLKSVRPGGAVGRCACLFWASDSATDFTPTTSFASISFVTGTVLADLGDIPATPEFCLLCATNSAGLIEVDVEVSGAGELHFHVSTGPFVSDSGAVEWI